MADRKYNPNLDSVTTIKSDGSRNFLHPSDVWGKFTAARRFVAGVLILVYAALPWIPINGYPAVFLDIAHRKFHLFGITLAMQDLWMLFFLITGLAFSLFFITALLGRLWCGWACPQTVFMEHVFRRIERLLEGDAIAQRKLDKLPWTESSKILRRGGKLAIFLLTAWLISHIFLAYFVSIPQLYQWMTHSPAEHWTAFMFMGVATLILFFNFTWFREQLCIVICPYGRLQSALTDDDSIIIGYDAVRGEPRGKPSNPDAGDCIACNRCVQVCPTGIDIRQGLQLECIGCANCIDACDEVMTKLKRPKGLIRYSSLRALEGLKTRILRPRIFLYSLLMLFGITAFAVSFNLRYSEVFMTTVRLPGMPFFMNDEVVRNQFTVRLINKQNEEALFHFEIESDTPISATGMIEDVLLDGQEERTHTLVIETKKSDYRGKFPMTFQLLDEDNQVVAEKKIDFLGPDPRLL